MSLIPCQQCSQPATVHLTKVTSKGQRLEIHLCEACAEKAKILVKKEHNLSAIIQSLVGVQLSGDELKCPTCGLKYGEFRAEGRLGCPHDYKAFRAGLVPLLQRIHQSGRHVGKSPRRDREATRRFEDLLHLRRQLHEAVEAERFEDAAQLRDLIRAKETQG